MRIQTLVTALDIQRSVMLVALVWVVGARPLVAQPGCTHTREVDQWKLVGGTPLQPTASYTVFNPNACGSLKYGDRDYGINLIWDRGSAQAVSFARQGNATGPITFGERLAVRIVSGGYLRYQNREYGINLVWSQTPVFEWEITGGTFASPVPAAGQIASATGVRLYNTTHGDYLVYGERDKGINLKWFADEVKSAEYPPLPFPPTLRSPSGEPGQIQLAGAATKVELFHGGNDDELDWHIFFRPDAATRDALLSHLLAHGKGASCANRVQVANESRCAPLAASNLEQLYAEWMVLDAYKNSTLDELFFSADVTRALTLAKPAWDYSAKAGKEQNVTGATVVPENVQLVRDAAYVYLQGPFVNDSDHGFRVEIHPLDSFAYALDASGALVRVPGSDPAFPAKQVTWRVAAFSNSRIHRIDGAEYVKRPRTTTWYLSLPRGPVALNERYDVTVTNPTIMNQGRILNVSDRRPTDENYKQYGVHANSYALARDPRDGILKLKVTVQMDTPDRWGGMFFADYTVAVKRGRPVPPVHPVRPPD